MGNKIRLKLNSSTGATRGLLRFASDKYLSGLLAGVLTAGVLQGSGGNENMPGLGGQQTPVGQQQSGNNLSFQQMARLLAENSYRNGDVASAEIILNSVGLNGLEIITEWGNAAVPALPTQITHITLNENNGIQEDTFGLSEMSLSKPETPSTPAELTQLTIGENGEIKEAVVKGQNGKKTKLDPYSMQVAAKYFESVDDLHNAMMVNSKFKELDNRNRKNFVPVTEKSQALFEYIETQQIFGPNDYILPDMYQYIITYPVTKKEIESWVNRLQKIHTNKAQTPIVFEYQLLPDFWNSDPQGEIITETKDFKIKRYYTDSNIYGEFFKKGGSISRYNFLKKPIVFENVTNICIEDEFDLFVKKGNHTGFNPEKHIIKKYEIAIWQHNIESTYSRYNNFIQRYPVIQYPEVEKVSFSQVNIDGKEINEQQKQFKTLSNDKKVERIGIDYNQELNKSPELLGNTKVETVYSDYVVYLQSFGKSRLVTFCCPGQLEIPVGIKLYSFFNFQWKNDDVSKKVKKYVQYVNDNNLAYLSGFVNFANKPSCLTDEEWRKVIVLTGMVEEIMDFVDQKFNEYEVNPYAGPTADPYGCGGNYGCDGYGCAGYNPYRQYYYGYDCGYDC